MKDWIRMLAEIKKMSIRSRNLADRYAGNATLQASYRAMDICCSHIAKKMETMLEAKMEKADGTRNPEGASGNPQVHELRDRTPIRFARETPEEKEK